MWVLFACGSALFAGLTAILAKLGIRQTDSDVATAIRTIVVLAFSWLMVAVVGSFDQIAAVSPRTLLFLVLSGLATGASWLCYFRALSLGDVNKVVPIDKSSIVLTLILSFIVLGEPISPWKLAGIVLIAAGTWLMIERKPSAADGAPKAGGEDAAVDAATDEKSAAAKGSHGWMLYAVLSAVFASLTAILGKIGISGVESNLGTAIRTCVVLVMAWVVVLAEGKLSLIRTVPRGELGWICLSGIATGASWLCYYRALHDGLASVVVPIDKLSVLVSVAFARIVFGERLTRRSAIGFAVLVLGTLAMLL